jgi:methionyl-tRNA formyltransferase
VIQKDRRENPNQADEKVTDKLRIGWIGFHVEGQMALSALLERGYRPEAVITLAEEQLAKRSGAFCYEEICRRHNLKRYTIRHINDPESVELLRRLALDVVFVIGWSQIIGPEALRTASLGMIGAHAAWLPHNRGSAPVNWAILRGESEGGNTLMWLSDKVDEGEIIDQTAFPITPYDTCATVYEKVAQSNCDMILDLLPKLMAGQRPARPQPAGNEPLLPRRRPEDGRIDWTQSSRNVYNFIRALTRPYPGAFGEMAGKTYWIWDAALLPGEPYDEAEPGRVMGPMLNPWPSQACGQVVACGRGAVVLLEVETPDGTVWKGRELSELAWEGKIWTHG